MRLPLLLLALFTIACSAPTNTHEADAQQFFSSLITALRADKMDDVTSVVIDKFAHFFPGVYKPEEIIAIKAAVARGGSLNMANVNRVNEIFTTKIGPKYLARIEALGKEAKEYFNKGESFNVSPEKLIGNCAKEMDKLIASFKTLSKEAQGQLKEQLPLFGMLEEIRTYAVVLDRIISGMKIVCAELPGFEYCKPFRN